MIKERWRAVIGYEGLYEVSDQGRVRSLNYRHTNKWKLLKLTKARHGYLKALLCKNGKKQTCLVHRLVAKAFPEICGEWFEGCDVNHKNECKTDNRAYNLEVCTRKHNINWGTGIEKRAKTQTNRSDISKPIGQYTLEGILVATYPSAHEAARQTGISQGNISRCCSGKAKTAGGFIWKYI